MMTTHVDGGQLGGRTIRGVVFDEDTVRRRVRQLGDKITEAYTPEDRLLVLGLLKGSFIFMSDLVRDIQLPLHVDFLVASSYGSDTMSSGNVQLLYDSEATLEDRAVMIVEDIVDSGNTMNRLVPLLEERGPKSLEICALLHKRISQLAKEPRWVGFDAPREFLVGYGLDFSENFRHLPYIASL